MKFPLWKRIHFTLSLKMPLSISRFCSEFRIPIVITDADCKRKHIKNSTQLSLSKSSLRGKTTMEKKRRKTSCAHNYFYIQYFENALHSFRHHVLTIVVFSLTLRLKHSKSISIQIRISILHLLWLIKSIPFFLLLLLLVLFFRYAIAIH